MGQQIDGMSHLLDGIPGEPWQQAVQSAPLSRAPRMCGACHHPEHGKEPCRFCQEAIAEAKKLPAEMDCEYGG